MRKKGKMFLAVLVLLLTGSYVHAGCLTVNSPKGGESWALGSTQPITWSNTCGQPVRIVLRKGGVKAGTIAANVPSSQKSYQWQVGQYQGGTAGVGNDYRILIKTMDNASKGTSGLFRIYKFTVVPGKVFKQKPSLKPGSFAHTIPVIESMLDVPLGALKAGSLLYLKGKNFGTHKGKILMYGSFPQNPVELINLVWENDHQVHGEVPALVNGSPNQQVEIRVVKSNNIMSEPRQIGFVGREEKVLTPNAVTVVSCGNDGNYNRCNNVTIGDPGEEFHAGCPQSDIAFEGTHENVWGAVGDDVGDDVYSINLKNGWVLKSMQKTDWYKSSGDEVLSGPSPAFPAGQSSWTPKIHWKVTPNDYVFYCIKIIVEGPLGTSYK